MPPDKTQEQTIENTQILPIAERLRALREKMGMINPLSAKLESRPKSEGIHQGSVYVKKGGHGGIRLGAGRKPQFKSSGEMILSPNLK